MTVTALGFYLLLACLWCFSFVKPIYGVLGYLVIYSVYNPDAWWIILANGFLPRPSFIAMAFVLASAMFNYNKLNWKISRKEYLFYLFLILCWVSTFVFGVNVDSETWEYVIKVTKLFFFIFFFLRVVKSEKDYKMVVWTIILCGIWHAYQAHINFSSGRLDSGGGVDFAEGNGIAAYLSIGVIFLGFQMLRYSLLLQIIFIFAIVLMLDAIILTESRSIFLGLIFAVPYVFLNIPPGKFKQISIYTFLGIVLFFILVDTSFMERMGTIGGLNQSITMNDSQLINQKVHADRMDFWRASIDIFRDHPWGIGVKNFYKIVPSYDPLNPGMDPHNTFVMCYSEIGILGIIVFLLISMETVFQIRRIRILSKHSHLEEKILYHLISIGTVLVIFFSGYMMTHSNLYVESLWILLSLPICLENATKGSVEKESYSGEK